PHHHLLLAVARSRLRLVEAGERAVVALVEAPVLLDGKPQPVHLLEREIERADGALEERGEREVEVVAFRGEHAAGRARFLDAALREIDVLPAGEAVLAVPVAFAMAEQNELLHA